jgi:hypothetical protein
VPTYSVKVVSWAFEKAKAKRVTRVINKFFISRFKLKQIFDYKLL